MRKPEDVIGRHFDRLEVIGYAESRRNPSGSVNRRCVCRCDCGNETVVDIASLRKGLTKSCGCLNREVRTRDIKGEKHEMLVAVENTGKKTRGGKSIWLWQCECGKTIETTRDAVTGGRKSCGCDGLRVKQQQAREMFKRQHLQDGTRIESIQNVNTISRNNTSGVRGVSWHKGRKKWAARIMFQGKSISLGYYDSIEDATAARKEAEQKYFIDYLESIGEMLPVD
jgi:AP2 domain.